ncbi:DNA polymerase III subunit alpha [Actinomyces slackii]|uniref:Error-prone DNA polymerase n=1 Tax=Actinomyces slackii TaxID=52774 RepID=A0A448KDY0_9ACTO|nr:DNA polymerase III subunit alpha [Actinomyces slackii]VEG75090.1 DNA polymerase III subunit alpha [Actinomyces slackii]
MFESGAPRYAELHAHSAYSFLDGANEPEDLVAAAAELGLDALALTDHDGMPGIVKHAQAGRAHGLPTIHGSELTLADGARLPILARDPRGYHRLVAAISDHNLTAGHRRDPAHSPEDLAPALAGTCLILTGTVNGPLRRALGSPHRPSAWDLDAADACLGRLAELFAPNRPTRPAVGESATTGLAVELALDGGPTDAALTHALTGLAAAHRLPLVATGAVRCARPADARLADVLTATRLVTDLEGARGHLPAIGRWLRGPADMARLHRRAPGAVEAAAEIGSELAFDLALIAPDLPAADVPPGHTPASWLRELTGRGATARYGSRAQDPSAWQVLDHELEIIEALGFAGYFLIVRSIVEFCERSGILCQGRGSAANSAVCYALGITAVDAVRHQMLFERFLSPGRAGYPDIDLDIEACRREEVIQHVYSRYGRDCAAQVANVISYRPRSAVRDAARALGHPAGLQDAWAAQMGRWSTLRIEQDAEPGALPPNGSARASRQEVPDQVLGLAERLLRLPRHLGIHPGGMVLADRPVSEVCPVRWAAMEGRSVLQWDKDDCAAAGLVKFDLLGLGMLTALRLAFTTLAQRGETVPEPSPSRSDRAAGEGRAAGRPEEDRAGDAGRTGDTGGSAPAGVLRAAQIGRPWDLHTLPEDDPAVYRLLTAADTVGVFQVESRAQMATLPRLRPTCFYDIVVEVALIRPGPIQGDAVSPYIRRRLKREPVDYLHDSLRPALSKTLGVPLFQEQLMQIAVDAAGFSPAEADALRQAMGAKRSAERMEALHTRFVEGMVGLQGAEPEVAEAVFAKLRAFADFGFPESHAFSFAYLVYASAWLKARKPEDFYAGVLAAQPMGFWSPQSLVADARRHGVRVLPADVNASGAQAIVESRPQAVEAGSSGARQWLPLTPSPEALSPLDAHDDLAVRLGLAAIKGIGAQRAEAIAAERQANGPYRDLADLARRVRLSRAALEALAASGALESLGVERREALWAAGVLAEEHGARHQGPGAAAPAVTRGRRRGPRPVTIAPRAPLGHDGTGQEAQDPPQPEAQGQAGRGWFQPTLPGTAVGARAPRLPAMGERERQVADLRLTGVTTQDHPMAGLREGLGERGILALAEVGRQEPGRRVRAAGVVTHRQRPHTATGMIFLNLEDETGLLNVVCSAGMWRRYRSIGRRATALIVRGTVERGDGVTALRAEHLEALGGITPTGSRDWC